MRSLHGKDLYGLSTRCFCMESRKVWRGGHGKRSEVVALSELGEGEDNDRKQEQEAEREASDCEQAVRVHPVSKHAFPLI